MELRLTSVLTMHLSYNGRKCNMHFPKHHAERMFAKCIVEAFVETEKIERKKRKHCSQISVPPFQNIP
jgi:hypothetical protein